MESIRLTIETVLRTERTCTCRQIFYRLVAMGAVDKTEQEYKGTVCRLLAEMRREGRIPFDAIADNTRWQRKPKTWGSLASALSWTQATYRRALWNDQTAYVEIWSEKDALAGVLYDVTSRWDVPLMVSRGFASLSFLYEAAMAIAAQGKPAYLYYFGDHDPSGVLIDRKIEQTLRELAPNTPIHFERVAVTLGQIERWNLPTRPTKRKPKDYRAKKFEGDSVEVDAMPPSELRALAEICITQHIDQAALTSTRLVEAAERDTLSSMLRRGLA